MLRRPPRAPLFPSPALFRSDRKSTRLNSSHGSIVCRLLEFRRVLLRSDRKSIRLNSSHGSISYVVFCVKKKTNTTTTVEDTALIQGLVKRSQHQQS